MDGERPYAPGVFYCKDAFEGLETVDRLQDDQTRVSFTAKLIDDARSDKFLSTNVGKDMSSGTSDGKRSDVSADNPVPSAPFFGNTNGTPPSREPTECAKTAKKGVKNAMRAQFRGGIAPE